MTNILLLPLLWLFQIWQVIVAKLVAPNPPPVGKKLWRPRIAIIGAGLTGVAAASHCVGHGFDVTIFEAGSRKQLGGIWAVCEQGFYHTLARRVPLTITSA